MDVRPNGVTQINNQDDMADFSNSSNLLSDKSKVESIRTDVREAQDFRRRIPHFFMGRFKKWSKMHNENEVHEFLKDL